MPFPIKIHEFSLQTELKWLYIFWWGNSLNTLPEGKSFKVELFMSTGRSLGRISTPLKFLLILLSDWVLQLNSHKTLTAQKSWISSPSKKYTQWLTTVVPLDSTHLQKWCVSQTYLKEFKTLYFYSFHNLQDLKIRKRLRIHLVTLWSDDWHQNSLASRAANQHLHSDLILTSFSLQMS